MKSFEKLGADLVLQDNFSEVTVLANEMAFRGEQVNTKIRIPFSWNLIH